MCYCVTSAEILVSGLTPVKGLTLIKLFAFRVNLLIGFPVVMNKLVKSISVCCLGDTTSLQVHLLLLVKRVGKGSCFRSVLKYLWENLMFLHSLFLPIVVFCASRFILLVAILFVIPTEYVVIKLLFYSTGSRSPSVIILRGCIFPLCL